MGYGGGGEGSEYGIWRVWRGESVGPREGVERGACMGYGGAGKGIGMERGKGGVGMEMMGGWKKKRKGRRDGCLASQPASISALSERGHAMTQDKINTGK